MCCFSAQGIPAEARWRRACFDTSMESASTCKVQEREPVPVNRGAIETMSEIGIDISARLSRGLSGDVYTVSVTLRNDGATKSVRITFRAAPW
jgi:hypothetical protein